MQARLTFVCALALTLGCATTPKNPDEPGGAGVAPVEDDGAPLSDAPPAEGEVQPIACERPAEFGPVVVDAEQYARRYAAKATRFAEVASTKEQPAEECGIAAGVELLMALTCEDGSRPFASFQDAHGSRAGNVGPGGRCGSIIDLYQVPCPEAVYEVYIDSYICADAAMFR